MILTALFLDFRGGVATVKHGNGNKTANNCHRGLWTVLGSSPTTLLKQTPKRLHRKISV